MNISLFPNNKDYLWVVNESDDIIGKLPKSEIHRQRLFHRQVYVLILNHQNEVLLQKRSVNKQFDPNAWTTSVSGHVEISDVSYETAAFRETYEELGIIPEQLQSVGKTIAISVAGADLCGGPSTLYLIRMSLPVIEIQRQVEEVSDVAYFDLIRVHALVENRDVLRWKDLPVILANDFKTVFTLYWHYLSAGNIFS